MCKKKDKAIEKAFDIGDSLAGSAAGAALGAVAGPLGIVAGALIGTVAEQTIILIGNEIKDRMLSKQESIRVGTVYQIAGEKINANLESGRILRDDDFFTSNDGGRPASEELLEGTLLSAQKEYEEKKLKYIGNLYGNLLFTSDITVPTANMLIKLAESLTYRQLCEIATIAMMQGSPNAETNPLLKESFHTVSGMNNVSIASEIFDLYQKTLLSSSDAIFDAAGINPSKLKVVGNGVSLYNLMELRTIPANDFREIIELLTGKTVIEATDRLVAGEARATAVFG